MTDPILSEHEVPKDPFNLFSAWYGLHLRSAIEIPETVFLGTASATGRVSVRTVLLKEYSEKGFTFFTNYNSRKGRDLHSNNQAALLFYWPEEARQVRIEGRTGKITPEESDAYFSTRPRESQLGAWTSSQSNVVTGRHELEERFAYFENLFSGKEIPRPDHWGGFRLIPDMFEFWLDRQYRLHDRVVYELVNGSWTIKRLAP